MGIKYEEYYTLTAQNNMVTLPPVDDKCQENDFRYFFTF